MTYRLLSDSATGGTLPGGVDDVRGWAVLDDDGRLLGAVADAVLDHAAQTRFLVVDLRASDDDLDAEADRVRPARRHGITRVLLPIGLARVGAPAGAITVPGVTFGDLLRLPEYRDDVAAIATTYERRLGVKFAAELEDPNALGATRSSDPDVGARNLTGDGGADRARGRAGEGEAHGRAP